MLKKNAIIILIVSISALLILLLVLLLSGNCCFKDRCEVPLKQFDATPIFFNYEDGTFVYPQDDAIVIQRDKTIAMACPGSTLNTGDLWVKMTCITETSFLVYNDNIDITALYCRDQIKSVSRYTGKSCENNGQEIEVGFDVGPKFIRQMRICFDPKVQTTFYVEHNLSNLIDNRELSSGRPYFEEGQFFNVSGNKLYQLYSKKVERQTINKQLNIAQNSTEVIKDGSSSYFLSRGHLAPKADFIFGSQQNASFYYVNAAPQWLTINSGSWNTLEWRIRVYAAKKDNDLQIFTGTFDNLVLDNFTPSKLYLYYNPPAFGIPIPKYFWKIVYDPFDKKGVAFVSTNNPYLKKENLNYICKDVLNSISWMKLKNQNVSSGIIYACDVNDLKRAISYVPVLQIDGLLTD